MQSYTHRLDIAAAINLLAPPPPVHTIHFLPVPLGELVPYYLFIHMGLHGLWRCRMEHRHAEQPRATKSRFIEEVAEVRSVYTHQSDVPC